ncbi:MAG TPA: hypothetical protein VLE95_04500 [Chlamydiales bacterium]|nr:hypothetical protein [Chlamydiales bacterium]
MTVRVKQLVVLSVAVLANSLFAQDSMDENENQEISMSSHPDRHPTLDECKGDRLRMRECYPREEEYDYDVYVQGEECNHCAPSERPRQKRADCDSPRMRKGAAQAAQE